MKSPRLLRSILVLFSLLLGLHGPASAEEQLITAAAKDSAHRPRVGLALGGGGTRGIAHITVLRVLEENQVPIDCIAGTSMGGIVGGLYAAGVSTDAMEKIFRGNKMVRSYNTVPIPLRVSLIPMFFVPHLFGYHPYDGLYKGNKFAHYMNNCVGESQRNIESLKIPFCAVCSNLVDGKPYAIKSGNLGHALQATSAIPGLRRPVPWQGQLLVDGGVVDNLPVRQCRAMGADIVIAVNVDEELIHIEQKHFRKIGSVPYRCLNMHLNSIDSPDVKIADLVIHPQVNGIKILSHKLSDMDMALQSGEQAAREALPRIKELLDKKLAEVKPSETEL